jgi:hypothetical protein
MLLYTIIPNSVCHLAAAEAEVVEGSDLTLWLGDLNYRINGSRPMVHFLLAAGMSEVLHANDQLRLQQKKGRVFQVGGPLACLGVWVCLAGVCRGGKMPLSACATTS